MLINAAKFKARFMTVSALEHRDNIAKLVHECFIGRSQEQAEAVQVF